MIYKKYNNGIFNLYTVKTDKFKTCHMEIIFYNKFDENNITKENVLSEILSYTNKKYNKRKLVVEHLQDLYNAKFMGTTTRVGKVRTINFVYEFIDPIYTDKSYLKEVIKFPFDMIFNPNVKNNEFDGKTLKIIKNLKQAEIESIKESPLRYSIKRALQCCDEDMPASKMLVGNIKDLNKINSSNLYQDYQNLLNNYYCDIYLVGNLNMDKINIMIKDLFNNDIIKNQKLEYEYKLNDKLVSKKIEEKDEFEQSILVCLFKLNNLSNYEKNYVMPVFNSIFGSGSLNNKLYKNLRGDNSLCYNVSSLYQKFDNLIIVPTGIDYKNKNKAISLIKKSLKEIEKGLFSDEDVENAKKSIVNSILSALDSPSDICDNYFFHNSVSSPLLDERMNGFDNVSKKDIINLTKKIKLVTTYMMRGEKNEGN